ncbi:AraC family transcriptional regulator [Metabacillus malikii]|uniref:YesN/AraC family two-component response regulator n=1 Tax=Metabacillus malikii TaxID=1504265 RepID=A0ABT9ZMA8_9BACI|nr:AraC family transcriptional regulator [Metabacillus malikii]MDQ0233044.1 YesN/AraC family two-component response regulator [Metabacillus malikii]
MNRLFESILFDLKPFQWIYRRISDRDFRGFYHWHQGGEFLFVHRGQGRVIVNQHTYELKPGMLFFFQPFQLHKVHVEVSSQTPYERSILHFDPISQAKNLHIFPSINTLFNRLQNGIYEKQAFDLSNHFNYVSEMIDAFNQSVITENWDEECQLFLMQILSCIRLNTDNAEALSHQSMQRSLRYSETIMQWMGNHYNEPFDLEKLSSTLHLSKPYVSRIFKRETGSSLTEYLTVRRMKQACHLLQMTNDSVELIAEQVGIGNVSYFIHLFKKTVGTTPHQHRISHQVM